MARDLPNPLLMPETLSHIGSLNADLLCDDVTWIHRRRERVEILDETALRRQVSIDFTLPAKVASLDDPALGKTDDAKSICVAPLVLLDKRPRGLMNFDFVDEGNRSLPLMTSADNGQVSAATLKEICSRRLKEFAGVELPHGVADQLEQIAVSPLAEALRWIERLESPLPSDVDPEIGPALLDDEVAEWWIRRLGDSSIVVALYEASSIERRIVKLSYEEPIDAILPLTGSLGWSPYEVTIVSPFVSAQTYHLEITAPHGLRITWAGLIDETRPVAEDVSGFNRRVHLYLPQAARARGASAQLRLRVSGPGFIGGAVLASAMVPLLLLALALFTDEIASNPTSVPALLVVLPGLFATYVGRSDQHALTTRLLAGARWLLLLSGLLAYAMAVRLAVSGAPVDRNNPEAVSDRADAFAECLYPAAGIAGAIFLAILLNWTLSHPFPRRVIHAIRGRLPSLAVDRFSVSAPLRLLPHEAMHHLVGETDDAVLKADAVDYRADGDMREATVPEKHRGWSWEFTVTVRPAPEGSTVVCEGRYVGRYGLGLLAPVMVRWRLWRVRRELTQLARRLLAS